MKALTLCCVVVFATGRLLAETNAPSLSQEHLRQVLQEAVVLARVGLYEEAQQCCRLILQQEPDQPTARRLLREIDEKQREMPGVELRRKLDNMIVPEVNLRQANAADAIDYLRAESKKLSSDNTEINFVWHVPPEQPLPKITLQLKNVPMIDAIRYVTDRATLNYRVDAHAVVIFVPEKAAPSDAKSK